METNIITTSAEVNAGENAVHFRAIRKLLLSPDAEDLAIGMGWLGQLIGERDAEANYLILLLFDSSEDDSDVTVNAGTYAKMKFSTYSTSFGKNYRYEVLFEVSFRGEMLLYDTWDYSRYQVGDGYPKFDMRNSICTMLRKKGVQFYTDLFLGK